MIKQNDATVRQIDAAEPTTSTWVSANAGSGKTRVLTDRVARLLLLGVPPEKILCLTYTKAAASEMQNRLFRRLGQWAMLPDMKLRDELVKLGAEPPGGPDGLRDARRLFARAIEAPGGLKIQTIHSFCAALLRRFPLEAGVSPDFDEMDDRAQRLLMEEIVDAMADGPEAALVEALARYYTGEDFGGLTAEVARNRARFGSECDLADWLEVFGLPVGFTESDLLSQTFAGHERAYVDALLPVLDPANRNEKSQLLALSGVGSLERPTLADLQRFEAACLTGKDAKQPFAAKAGETRAPFPKKSTRQALGPALDGWDDFMRRVETARTLRCGLMSARRNHALHSFAAQFIKQYADRKQARGFLDFDDLILRAIALLSRPGVAEWVLFRLDGGIDHILVDEAQDTSPEQWEVVRLIAEEFSTGKSARSDVQRTLFVVGDLKQSIYSFQGADPANFDLMARHFDQRFQEVGKALKRAGLLYSFRSAPAILRVVDQAFAAPDRHAGLGGAPQHEAFRADMPGRVDLWPAVPKPDDEADPAWYDPVDRLDPAHHDITLARMIAEEIERLCGSETLPLPPKDGQPRRRPLRPGDFLILVQRRSTLFAEIIRACKDRGLPIAGADRLRLGGELAVKDLAALLSFLATPEDDLSLAGALKSPLFGWSEDRVYRVAHGRGDRYLWEVLRERQETEAATLSILNDLRREADFLRPFELLERILTRHGGRQKLLARLGPEAEDGIDALLAQAMAYERMDVPSLTGFLTWMETDDVEVKRQLDSGGGVVRVMTVHGAKGLEAPVVFLPDTRAPQNRDRGEIVLSDGTPLWKTRAEDAPPRIAEAVADRKYRQAEERMRLLYVAMTRAENWLIVAGAGETETGDGGWHRIVREALVALDATPIETPAGEGLRFDHGAPWDTGPIETEAHHEPPAMLLPAWAWENAALPEEPPAPLSPSDLGGAKALADDAGGYDEDAAKRRGRLLHRLFEHLPGIPGEDRLTLAHRLLATGEDTADPEESDALFTEAARILDDPAFEWLFTADALAEVEIAADLPDLGGRTILGAIDRLIVTDDRVLAVDYKTNTVVPDSPTEVPEGILRQMAAYASALKTLYPDRTVETAVLWTTAPRLMPLPHDLLRDALARVSVS